MTELSMPPKRWNIWSQIAERKAMQTMESDRLFPAMVTDLPEADIPFEGLRAYLLQGNSHQIVFMSFVEDVDVPEHSHEAQWAVVLEGEVEMTIGGRKQILGKGDTYFVPKGILHSARIKKGTKDITFFDQKDRYRAK